MANEADIILPLMREMRAELTARFDAVDRRIVAIETETRMRQAATVRRTEAGEGSK